MRLSVDLRCSHGYDAHPFEKDRSLVLCGIPIPDHPGLRGNSDADVALHAVMDALLGACCLGDLGTHFPPDAETYRNASSSELLLRVMEIIRAAHPSFHLEFLDVTLICKSPKLYGFRQAMRENLAARLNLPVFHVSVKFCSGNGLGFTGRGEGIAAIASATTRL